MTVSTVGEILLDRAPENTNEARKERIEEYKAKAVDSLKDIGKIALSAAATGLAVRFFSNRGNKRR